MKPLLCILVLAAVAASVSWPRRPSPEVVRVSVPARHTSPSAPHQDRPAPESTQESRAPVPTPWTALESGDFARFVRHLRASGCPEETVQIFALAAVGRFHQQQVERPLREEVRRSHYWQLTSPSSPDSWPTSRSARSCPS